MMNDIKSFIDRELTSDGRDTGLNVGDRVRWVNDYGVVWENRVIGFNYDREYNRESGKYVHLDTDSFWFPHRADSLEKI